MTDGGDSLGLTWQNFVLWPEWSGSLKVSWVGRFPVWCFVRMLRSEGTAYNVPRSPSRSSRRPHAFVNCGVFGQEISHTLPVRHADGIASLGALSPLGGHSCDDPKKQDVSYPVANFGRAANFEEESTRYGAWLDGHCLRIRRTSIRASCPEAIEIEECVEAIRCLPLAWSDPSRWHTIVQGNFKFRSHEGRSRCSHGSPPCRRWYGWTRPRFLSLTDNMSCLLAFDRGRSCSYDLLCLCRRAAALCIGADVSWILRH